MEGHKLIENTSKTYFNGSEWINKNKLKFKIIGRLDKCEVFKDNIKHYNYYLCEFEDKTVVSATYTMIKNGSVKNPNYPSVCGIGYMGQGKWSSKCNPKEYSIWLAMMQRCYSEKFHIKNPTYKNVIVCERWLSFQNFCEDIQYIQGYNDWKNNNGYELDKDTLCSKMSIEPKIYSPETCLFVNKKTNVSESTSRNNLTGLTYIGISPDGNQYEFTNQKEFANKYHLCKSVISACINNKRTQRKGWTFRIKEKNIL